MKGDLERDNSRDGAAVQNLASPFHKGVMCLYKISTLTYVCVCVCVSVCVCVCACVRTCVRLCVCVAMFCEYVYSVLSLNPIIYG